MVGLLKAPIHSLGNMIERRGRPTKGPDALSGTVVRSTTAGQNIQLLREQKDFDFTDECVKVRVCVRVCACACV